jgi:hypothetical protein
VEIARIEPAINAVCPLHAANVPKLLHRCRVIELPLYRETGQILTPTGGRP